MATEEIVRNSISGVITKLRTIQEQVQNYLDNAESVDNPNADRIEKLEEELQRIECAIDELEGIE